jgi:hypothetical protein
MARGPLAGAAGPGKFSKRTDLNMGSIAYGEGVETAAIKAGAPLAKTPNVNPMSRSEQGMAPSQIERVTPLFAPTQRPDEPITTGINIGAGAGSEALMMQSQFAQQKISDTLAQMLPYDQTGEIGILYQQALSRGM